MGRGDWAGARKCFESSGKELMIGVFSILPTATVPVTRTTKFLPLRMRE
jgi:hypothetical protein